MKTFSAKTSKLLPLLLTLAILISPTVTTPTVFAADELSFRQLSSPASGYEGGFATLKIEVSNSTSSDLAGTLVTGTPTRFNSSTAFTAVTSTTLPAITTVTCSIDLSDAEPGNYTVPVVANWDGGGTSEFTARVQVKALADEVDPPAVDVANVTITHDLDNSDGIIPGEANDLSLLVTNKGDVTLSNVIVSLSLPSGLSLDNDSASKPLDSITVNSHKHAVFPVIADDSIKSGSYALSVTVDATYGSGSKFTTTQTVYVPVKSGGSQIQSNLEITGITVPAEVNTGEDFQLTFSVTNTNVREFTNLKISVDGGADVINKSKNIFIEPTFKKAGTKTYSVTYYVPASSAEKFYPIKISVEPSFGTGTDGDIVSQYTGVLAKSIGGSKKPQLIVENYSYGGAQVQAGSNFQLALTLLNTSASQSISNIKITLSSEDGSFIPYNSSNSFYIESIGKKQKYGKTLNLSVKPDAVQKTTAVTVSMSYEDSAGTAYESNDVISIPVMQQTKLVVDDIIAPPDIYTGQPMSVSVQFYNMGKTVLSNLKITAEGNFTPTESTNTYVGNMEKGNSDYYDFSFIPNEAGPMTGNVIFTYEDLSGNQQVLKKAFTFQVMDMPEQPIDPGMPPPDTGSGSKLPFIIAGVLLALATLGIIIWRKIRKNKKAKELEFLDE